MTVRIQKSIKRTIIVNDNYYRLQFPYIVFHNHSSNGSLSIGFCKSAEEHKFVYAPCLPSINYLGHVCMHGSYGLNLDVQINLFWNSAFCTGHWDDLVYRILKESNPEFRLPLWTPINATLFRKQKGIIEGFFEKWSKTDDLDTILGWCRYSGMNVGYFINNLFT